MVALNAKLQIAMMVTLNVKLRTDNGSKRQLKIVMALNAETGNAALNVKLRK